MSVQDILLQQAMQDNLNQPDPSAAMAIGGAGGALLGIGAGHIPQKGAEALTGLISRRPAAVAKPDARMMAQRMKGMIRPGFRAAGGLVGLMAGGALGAGVANAFSNESAAGNMLARIQSTGGNLSAMDQMRLEAILSDSYNNMGQM